jgi:hypothetical protein
MKKARRAKLVDHKPAKKRLSRNHLGKQLFELATAAQTKGWSAEDILRSEIEKRERALRKRERLKPS